MEAKVFEHVWNQLRGKRAQYSEYLQAISLKNIRGIQDLSIEFNYPVTVIAGENASGKSTVLFACACAYRPKGLNYRDYTPAAIFPGLKTQTDVALNDDLENATEFSYYYKHQGKSPRMRWARGKNASRWNHSFFGAKNGTQPERTVYLRTLTTLSNPAEARSALNITQDEDKYETEVITPDLVAFAIRILPAHYRYEVLKLIKKGNKDLLFAVRGDNAARYSEFQMSAGERALLRLSKNISRLKNALILIDEIEVGLHPYTQQMLMLELQQLAIRNELQIIVTTHSLVVMESVPPEARVFLERTNDNVVVCPPYKNLMQRAFYGRALDKLNILCEDDIAEGFIYGVLDVLGPKLGLLLDEIDVGRDTGKDQFPQHIEAIGKFRLLEEFIFVLDGDARQIEARLQETASKHGKALAPLFLPGDVPEAWLWKVLKDNSPFYASQLGLNDEQLQKSIGQIDQLFDNTTGKNKAEILKNKFATFADQRRITPAELTRKIVFVAMNQTAALEPELKIFCDLFENQLTKWQARN